MNQNVCGSSLNLEWVGLTCYVPGSGSTSVELDYRKLEGFGVGQPETNLS